ncbi:MAG: hypothetical protein ACRDOU_27725 [Streptosporangiaceae bacterium]
MTGLIYAEALKLRSTRSFWAITLGALAISTAAVAALSAASTFTPGDRPARLVLAIACPQGFALVLGVIAVAGEFRHKTITPAVLITPRRTLLLGAKLIALTGTGLVLGLLAYAGAAAAALPILSARHVASHIDAAGLAGVIAGGTAATALFAALGVGIGALVRNQAGAIIAALGLIYVLGPVLTAVPGIGSAIQRFGPTGLSSGASGTAGLSSGAHLLGQVPAAVILGSYALAVLLAGAMVFRQRDLIA